MTAEVIRKVVQEFAAQAAGVYGDSLSAVILYGSCTRGDFETDSDIDLFVLLDVAPDKISDERGKINRLSDRLDLEFDVVLSPVVQSREVYERYLPTSVFYQNVEQEGIKVA